MSRALGLLLLLSMTILGGAPATADALPAALRTITPAAGDAGAPAALGDAAAGAIRYGARTGWPVNLGSPGAGYPYTPTLFDADHDGADEIFLTGGETFGLRGDGSFLPGWPTAEMAYMGYGTNDQKPGPSAADLDGDGDTEILWSERDWWAGSAHMWCFNARNFNGTNLPNFPQQAPDGLSNALDVPFVLGDVDGDGDLEAWGPHTLGNNFVHYRISAFDHLGTRLFTRDLSSGENALSLYFGDLDGDGAREMFTVALLGQALRLHAFAADGYELPGFPRVLYTIPWGNLSFGPPVPVDLDHDGDLEILIGHWGNGVSRVLAFHHDASPCAGFPIQVATNHQLFYIGLGDLTGDGAPELLATGKILSSDFRIHAFDLATGMLLPGWPYALPYWPEGFPSVVDVDNDGFQDVCVSTSGGDVRAVSRDGGLIAGYPKPMSAPAISGVAAGDIDGDGFHELVAATCDGWVYAWDTGGEVRPGRADWPMRNVNPRNTGVFGDLGEAADVGALDAPVGFGLRVETNPVLSCAQFRLAAGGQAATIEVYDATGRRVGILPTRGRTALTWAPPAGTAAGAYLARLRGTATSEPIRFVLLR